MIGGVTLANGDTSSDSAATDPAATVSPQPDDAGFAEFARPATAADSIDGYTDPKVVDRASARRISGLPDGWEAWIAHAKLPRDGSDGICLLYWQPSRSKYQAGPPLVCDSVQNVRERGLGGFRDEPAGSPITVLTVTPPDVTINVKRGTALVAPSQAKAKAGPTANAHVSLVRDVDPVLSLRTPAGSTQTIDPNS